MAITGLLSGTRATVLGNTAAVPTIPDGMSAGRLLLMVHGTVNHSGVAPAPNAVDGWVQEASTAGAGVKGEHRMTLSWARWTSGMPNPSITLSAPVGASVSSYARVYAPVGAPLTGDPTAFLSAITLVPSSFTDLGPIPGGPAPEGSLVLVPAIREENITSANVLTGDSLSWVEVEDVSYTTGDDMAAICDYALVPTARTISDKTFTITNTSANTGRALAAVWIINAEAPPLVPLVNAGVDVDRHTLGTPFTRTATEDGQGSAITSRSWSITSGPAGVGQRSTTATVDYTPTVPGTYVFEFTATNAVGPGSDTMTLTVPDPTVPIWSADFESGNIADYAITNNPGDYASPNFADIETGTALLGTRALRSTVNPETTTGRAEREWLSPDFVPGDDLWFGYRVRLDPNVQVDPPGFQLVTQWKNAGTGSPPIALHVEGGKFELQGGFGYPGGSRSMPTQDLGPATTGVWVDWVFHIQFEEGPDAGVIDVWRDGVHFVVAFTPPGGTLYPGAVSYWKSGLYRATSNATPATVHIDELRIGYTRQAVELPVTPSPARGAFLAFFG